MIFLLEKLLNRPKLGRARRRHIPDLTAVIDTGRRYWAGPVRDLSATGCFVLADRPAKLGTRVRVHPTHPDDDHLLPWELVGTVVRRTSRGFALAFESVNGLDTQQLRAFVSRDREPDWTGAL